VNQKFSDLTQIQLTKDLLIDALTDKRQAKFMVTSNSMAPILRPGDQVIVEGKKEIVLHRGDIVVFSRSADLMTHRLVTFDDEGWFVTKGDNHLYLDPPIVIVDILGRVTKIIKREKVIDLKKMEWVTINRVIGWCGRLMSSLHRFYESVKRYQAERNSIIRDGRISGEVDENYCAFIHRLLWFPYRFITRTVIRVFIH